MLPKQIDPIQLANNESTLKGELCLEKMERLREILSNQKGIALIDLKFGRDALGYVNIKGSIRTEFNIICQRCNLPMPLLLDISVEVSPVFSNEEAERLPKNYDPLLMTEDTISLNAMVEEEILLSIPIVPRHSIEECPVKSSHLIEWEEEKEKEKNDSNPFTVLKKLLRE